VQFRSLRLSEKVSEGKGAGRRYQSFPKRTGLVGEPIGAKPQKGQPEIGVVFNVGGSAVTNCTTTLKRIK